MYVGPQGSPAPAPRPAAVDPGLQTTQTVYGFLDFTTTIGNTVMVFSPQSAPAPTTPAPATTPAPVIETRPAAEAPAPAAIQPSKPTATKQPAVLSSVVEVRGGDPPVNKVSGARAKTQDGTTLPLHIYISLAACLDRKRIATVSRGAVLRPARAVTLPWTGPRQGQRRPRAIRLGGQNEVKEGAGRQATGQES